MQKHIAIAAAVVLASATWVSAQDAPAYSWIKFHRVHLRNGNVIEGALTEQNSQSVTLRQPWGDILIRYDQIDRVEFVKIKSFKDPELIVNKKKPASAKPAEGAAAADASKSNTPEPPSADRPEDSKDAVPSSIPADVVASVNQAITLWKSVGSNERVDLADALTAQGAKIAPYLEFLLAKRPTSTPLVPVTMAFVNLDEERFLEFSKKMMASPSSEIREAAILGVTKATNPARMPIIFQAMEDSSPSVWKTALEAMLVAAKSKEEKTELVDQIGQKIRTSKNATAFAVALSRIGGPDAHRLLFDLVGDNDETARLTGLHGLGILADPADGPRLIGLLSDQSEMIRKSTCLALGKMKYAPAVSSLINVLQQNNVGVSDNARWALKEITGAIVPDKNDAWIEWWEVSGSKSDRFQK